MRLTHYLLRQAKARRNCAAHSSDVINGFARRDSTVSTSALVSEALAEAGISRRVRQAKMCNARLQQITTLLFLHTQIVPEGTSKRRAAEDIARLESDMRNALGSLSGNDAVRSSFEFLMALFDRWF